MFCVLFFFFGFFFVSFFVLSFVLLTHFMTSLRPRKTDIYPYTIVYVYCPPSTGIRHRHSPPTHIQHIHVDHATITRTITLSIPS